MFQHVLVPLDGSPMAEAALPAAARLAELLGAEVTLLHAVERGAPETVHGEPHLASAEEARAYLEGAAARAFPAGTRTSTHVHRNEIADVARSIAEHAGELAGALIVMCTHGRGGLGNLLLGNIAQRVVEFGAAPVLLVPADKPATMPAAERRAARPFACERLLAPLDGEQEHERALPVACELARACAGTVRLLFVVPTPTTLSNGVGAAGRLLPGTAAAMLDMAEQDAGPYLERVAGGVRTAGVETITEVRRGDPADAIRTAAREWEADVIVMATHRRGGMQAFWEGSVAHRVASYARRPVLLVPVKD
jgi:nucleotide-binding universal stress UspA family protein